MAISSARVSRNAAAAILAIASFLIVAPAFADKPTSVLPRAERLTITTQRFFHGHPGPAISWKVYIVPPAK